MTCFRMIDVTCAIIIKDNKILVTQRSEKMKLPLKWEFPGGKIEKDETPENCLLRELREELNIEVRIVKKLTNNIHDYGSFEINLIPFIVTYISGEITLSEHAAYLFLDRSQLGNMDWAEADLPILQEFIKSEL